MLVRAKSLFLKYEVLIFSVFFLFQRLSHIQAIFSPLGFIPPGSDPYYRMHRAKVLLDNGLRFDLMDPLLNFPDGSISPWTPGLEYIVAWICSLLGLQNIKDVVTVSILIVPFLCLPLIWLVKPVLLKFTNAIAPRAATYLGMIFLPSMILTTSLGRLDHHFLEASQVMMMLWIYFLSTKPKLKIATWSVFFAVSWFFWPHAWMLHFLILPLAIYDRNPLRLRNVGLGLLIASILDACLLFWMDPVTFSQLRINVFGITWFSSLTAFASGVTLLDLQRFIKNSGKGYSWVKRVPWISIGLISIGLLVISSQFAELSRSIINSLISKKGTLSNTNETIGALRYFSKFGFDRDMVHVLLIPFCMIYLYRRDIARPLIAFAALPIILFFLQIRFHSMMFPLSLMILMLALYFGVMDLTRSTLSRKPLRQVGIYFMVLLLLVAPIHDSLGRAYPNNYANIHHIKKASQFIASDIKSKELSLQHSGIGARWMFGHWILLYAGAPIVASPFQGQRALDFANFLYTRDPKEYQSFIDRHPIRYLLLINAPKEHFMQFQFFHPDDKDVLKVDPNDKERVVVKQEFMNLLVSDFLYTNAQRFNAFDDQVWRVVYASKQKFGKENDFSDIKVFERVPGAKIMFASPPKGNVRIEASITIEPQETFTYTLHRKERPDGQPMWLAPYGARDETGILFDGKYLIKNDNGSIVKEIFITEQDVLEGNLIEVVL